MNLHFPWKNLAPLFEEIDTATTARELYGAVTGKGFFIVGDDGVYLMANTTDGIHHSAKDKPLVVYARECDPTKLDFDTWWAAKQASWGGDDGVEYLEAEDIRAMGKNPPEPGMIPADLVIEFTGDQMAIGVEWIKPTTKPKPNPKPKS